MLKFWSTGSLLLGAALTLAGCQTPINQFVVTDVMPEDENTPGVLGLPRDRQAHLRATLVYGDATLFALRVEQVETQMLAHPIVMNFRDTTHHVPADDFEAYELLNGGKTGFLHLKEILDLRVRLMGYRYELVACENYRGHLEVTAVVTSSAPARVIPSYDDRETEAWGKLKVLFGQARISVKVLSPTELEVNGVRCRLLGVVPKKDPAQSEAAKRLLELYCGRYDGYCHISNRERPVSAADGTPLIFLGGAGPCGWAQEVLVQAGLVDVRFAGFEDYVFYGCNPKAGGWKPIDWQAVLRRAAEQHKAGGRFDKYFEWIPRSPW